MYKREDDAKKKEIVNETNEESYYIHLYVRIMPNHICVHKQECVYLRAVFIRMILSEKNI